MRPPPDPVYLATLDLVSDAAHRLHRLGFEVAATPEIGGLIADADVVAVVWWTGDALGDWAALEAFGWLLACAGVDTLSAVEYH